MKLVAVCGMGIGTAVLLKMNAEKALVATGVDGVVGVASLSDVDRVAHDADVLLVSADCAGQLQGPPAEVVVIDDVLDLTEISSKVETIARR